MSRIDEPALEPEASRAEQPESGLPLPDRIRALGVASYALINGREACGSAVSR